MKIPFTPYKNAVAKWLRERRDYFKLDDARKTLCAALGYKHVHDHLGEYCNLHERDIPGCVSASRVSSLCLTSEDIAQGRNWSYSGFCRNVTYDELQEMHRRHVARSAELEKWFMKEPIDKFLSGAAVVYRGLSGDNWYVARFVPASRDALSSVRIEKGEFFTSTFERQPIMSETDARSFFANLGEITFTSQRMSDQRKEGAAQ